LGAQVPSAAWHSRLKEPSIAAGSRRLKEPSITVGLLMGHVPNFVQNSKQGENAPLCHDKLNLQLKEFCKQGGLMLRHMGLLCNPK